MGDNKDLVNFCLSNTITGALYPMTYIKVLMQLGYEPCPPQPATSFFNRPILVLPGILGYSAHIYQRAGALALYDGVFPFLCHKNLSTMVNNRMLAALSDKDEEAIDIMDFLVWTVKDTVAKCTSVIIAHPFHVIFIRSAAQFVGRECSYNSLWNSMVHIFKTEGIRGFFAGLVPSLLYETLVLWTTNVMVYVFNIVYTEKNEDLAQWPPIIFNMVATSVLYPFVVVTNCMSVSDSGLALGEPPYMPRFKNWMQCWRWLDSRNELKRGGSIWFQRRYLGPQKICDGCAVPIKCDFAS